MTVLPASTRFVPASTAAASKLVLFDVMDTIVADPFFRGFHKVAHASRPAPPSHAHKHPSRQADLGDQAASPHRQPS